MREVGAAEVEDAAAGVAVARAAAGVLRRSVDRAAAEGIGRRRGLPKDRRRAAVAARRRSVVRRVPVAGTEIVQAVEALA